MRLVMLGPPGAGKGTQAVRLAGRFGVPHVATGDIFRANAASDTPLGRLAKQYMDRGEYVPDDVVIEMVAERLAQPDAEPGFVLDGFPRTAPQADALHAHLQRAARPLDAVLRLVVDEDAVVARLIGRREIEGRVDDTEAVIRRRLVEYRTKTLPLEEFYAGHGLLRDVDGMGDVDQVTERALEVLERGEARA